MIELTEVKIKELITKKKAELDQLIIDVNSAIARKNGEIAALSSLIEPDPPTEEKAPSGPPKKKESQTKKT
jgi:hypothetical protein